MHRSLVAAAVTLTVAGSVAAAPAADARTHHPAHSHSAVCTRADQRLAATITSLTGHRTSCAEAARLRIKGQ
jgi:hypothetical protein